jgi:hypothetical protein
MEFMVDPATGIVTRKLPTVPTLEQIHALEEEIAKLPPVETKTTHQFAKGLYIRSLFIPAGTFLTGKLHKSEHLSICAQGDITVLTPEGMKRVQAPHVVVCPAGTKRAAYTHTDTLWINVHATHERDLDKLEALLIEPEERVGLLNAAQAARFLEKLS